MTGPSHDERFLSFTKKMCINYEAERLNQANNNIYSMRKKILHMLALCENNARIANCSSRCFSLLVGL